MSTNKRTEDHLPNKGVYLDCNSTTPLEPAVLEIMLQFLRDDFGNEGSRTHEYGALAKQAVQKARDQVAAVAQCHREEVIFTSGATEANNLALLGLVPFGIKAGKRHVISTAIEHKAVLEPLQEMERQGFEVTLVPPNFSGKVTPESILSAIREDTLLVSIMHANNETGILQPIPEILAGMKGTDAFLHVDAAQTFGKIDSELNNSRLDLISISGHKIYGPKGVGALITRRRGYNRIPLSPLMFGGGQERGLRPGTLPVPQIVGFGEASSLAHKDLKTRTEKNRSFKKKLLNALAPLSPKYNGDQATALAHCVSVAFPKVNSESLMVALKGLISISNGSACTSSSYTPSHVLKAMNLSEDAIKNTVRISWCHLTPDVDWQPIVDRISKIARLN